MEREAFQKWLEERRTMPRATTPIWAPPALPEADKLGGRWLGLGCEIRIYEKSSDLESAARARNRRRALEILMRAKKIALPDEQAWRNPYPGVVRLTPEQIADKYPAQASRMSMSPAEVGSQTGERASTKKHSTRKGKSIRPKPVKIQKG